MKLSMIIGLVLAVILNDFNDIATINQLKDEAESAYEEGNFQVAFQKYSILVDSFSVNEDGLLLNLANSAYFLSGMRGKIDDNPTGQGDSNFADAAMSNYQKLTTSPDRKISSAAHNQIGVINYQLGNNVQQGQKYLDESLAYFKQSLIQDPANDNARYNYEVVKKKLENQQDQQQQQDQDQNSEDQKDQNEEEQEQQQQEQQQQEQQEQEQQEQEQQEQQNQEGEKNDEGKEQQEEQQQPEPGEQEEQEQEQPEPTPQEKLKEMNISEDMAKMILEALRNNEVQYIQQQKRKPTKKADSKKPDW